jgi:hypothetical protein
VPSELIIVDTGSADSTVEIAKGFTDKIFHFSWIDDFAAARNFGLEKCSGEWFMFVDADEVFADTADMIEFFSDGQRRKDYNAAFFSLRNFTSTLCDEYYSFYAHRAVRRSADLRFKGAIHEHFTGSRSHSPAFYFDSYANHYGYAFETAEQKREKSERNFALIEKELAENPDDLRTIIHAIGAKIDMDERKRALIKRAVELSDRLNDSFSFSAYFIAFDVYSADKETEKALTVIDKALAKAKPNGGALPEAYACKGRLLHAAGRFAEAEESIKNYLHELGRLERGELDKSVFAHLVVIHSSPEKRRSFINLLALCISAQGRHEDALAAYDDADFANTGPADFIQAADTILTIAEDKAAYPKLAALYARVLAAEDSDKTARFEQMLEKIYFRACSADCDNLFAESFAESGGRFAEFMRICKDDDIPALEKFVTGSELPEGFSAAVMLALKHNIDLSGAISKMNLELMRKHLAVIAQNNPALPLQAINYRDDTFFYSSIKTLLFGAMLFEAACYSADMLTYLQKLEVYSRCINYFSLYVRNAYNPELLNEDDIGALPESHRFGYYMGGAKSLLDNGDKLGYIRELKKALASCNSMQKIIKFKIEEFSALL